MATVQCTVYCFLALLLLYVANGLPVDTSHQEDIVIDDTPAKRELLQTRIMQDLADMVDAEMALKELDRADEERLLSQSYQSENFIEVFDPNNTFHNLKGPVKGELVWKADVEVEHPEVIAAMPDEDEVQAMYRGTRSDVHRNPQPTSPVSPGITHNLHFLNNIRNMPEYKHVTPATCSPVKYKKSNLFVQLASGQYHRVTLEDMTIDQCACR